MASNYDIIVEIWDQWIEDSYIDSPKVYILAAIASKLYLLNEPVNELD